jgi:purine-binding chemotaxis protein CheW
LPELNSVAQAPRYVVGVVNFRGKILPVMDLSIRLGQPRRPYQIHDHVIVLQQGGQLLGMIVNEVHGVQEIAPETIDAAPVFAGADESAPRFIGHLARLDATAIMLLDHELLLSTGVEPRAGVGEDLFPARNAGWGLGTDHASARNGVSAGPLETMLRFCPDATPRELELLHERAQNLASCLEEQAATQQIALAIVGLSGEFFGIELEAVREFTDLQRITPVPCCPDYVVGDMNLRGDILTVVDIRQALQMPVREPSPAAKVIVMPRGDALVGVLVDHVFDVFDLDPADLIAAPSAIKSLNDTYLKGTVPYCGKMLAILDLPKILTSSGLTVNEGA